MNTLLSRLPLLLAAALLAAAVPARGEEPAAPAPAPSEDSAPLAPPRHFGTDFLERSSLLTHHGNRGDFRRRMLSRGLSEDEALDLLREIVVSLRSPGETDGDWRRRYALTRAVSAVGAFAPSNALPFARSLLRSGDSRILFSASGAYWSLVEQDLSLLSDMDELLSGSFPGRDEAAYFLYEKRVGSHLRWGGPDADARRALSRFLLERTATERSQFAVLDEILCEEVPRWRGSALRLARAERLADARPGDAAAAALAASVRADAAAGADAARPPAGSVESVDDLLLDLPDREPWRPAPGQEIYR